MALANDNALRLGLRVALKLMAAVAALGVLGVAIGYFAGGPSATPAPVERIDLAGVDPGEAKTVLWAGRPVIVLRRGGAGTAGSAAPDAWFVAFATDPGSGCPVDWNRQAGVFRSTCGSARYGRDGGRVDAAGSPLAQPPHHFGDDGMLVLGRR